MDIVVYHCTVCGDEVVEYCQVHPSAQIASTLAESDVDATIIGDNGAVVGLRLVERADGLLDWRTTGGAETAVGGFASRQDALAAAAATWGGPEWDLRITVAQS